MRVILVNRATGKAVMPGRFALGALGLLVLVMCFGSGVALHDLLRGTDVASIAQNGQYLEQQRARSQARVAEQEERRAMAKRIGEVQARLLRVEALGNRVLEAASIPVEEFDFGEAPGQGGPAAIAGNIDPPAALTGVLDRLERDLESREVQLRALGELLEEHAFDQERRPIGRPIRKGWLSSRFGNRIDPLTGERAWHTGVDYAGARGSDVVAVAGGLVVAAERRMGYGLTVEIDHGGGLSTRYAHLSALRTRTGELVRRGSVVGALGSSGRSTGPHVHLEVVQNGKLVDPLLFVRAQD